MVYPSSRDAGPLKQIAPRGDLDQNPNEPDLRYHRVG